MTETAPTDFDEAVARAQAATEKAPPQAEFLPEDDDVAESPSIELFVQVEGEALESASDVEAEAPRLAALVTDGDRTDEQAKAHIPTPHDLTDGELASITGPEPEVVEADWSDEPSDEEIDTLVTNLKALTDDDAAALLEHVGEVEAALMLTWEHEDRWQRKFCKLCNLSASRDGVIPHEPNCIIPKLLESDEEAE